MNPSSPIRVLIADDHAIVRNGVCGIVNSHPDLKVVAEAENGSQTLEAVASSQPDVCLIDLQMPDLDGVDISTRIRRDFPQTKIIILTTYDSDEDIDRCLRAGAQAYLLKDIKPSELIAAIKDVHCGRVVIPPSVASKIAQRLTRVQLTTRELEVLRLISDGLTNKEIAQKLFIAESTVKLHSKTLFEKLQVTTRTEAMRVGLERGLVRVR
ncbi:response regulator transcription factor [Nostoc sp. NIES-2111]